MKKKVFIVIFCLLSIFSFAFINSKIVSVLNQKMLFPSDRIVIIDAGHGGFDGGAVADDGTMEKDLNLSTAKKLNDMLLLCGYDTVMIREDDISVEEKGSKNKKKSDIHHRLKISENFSQAIFLSIHQNSFRQTKSHGAQVFYGVKDKNSQLLADAIQKGIVDLVQQDNTRVTKKAEKNLFLLTNIKNPCAMVECGFITNLQELKLLKDDEYQQKLMFAVAYSLEKYYKETGVETIGEG